VTRDAVINPKLRKMQRAAKAS